MIDVKANRYSKKWSRRELAGRVLWALVQPFFRLSPRPFFWGWRRCILRLCGAKIDRDVHIYPSVHITMPWNLNLGAQCAVGDKVILYALGPITIRPRATVSQGAHLCAGTHDITDMKRRLLKPSINIGDDAWVCAEAFIGPGVTVGNGSIIGARAVAMKDIPAGVIVAGNPAREIRKVPFTRWVPE